jgi:hypothetical protein
MSDLAQVISERRSTRMFLPYQPVPRELVEEALALAVHSDTSFIVPTTSTAVWTFRPLGGTNR